MGNPIDFILTGGEVHDNTQIQALLIGHQAENVLADRGYDADETLAFIRAMGASPVIPPKSNRKNPQICDWYLYKERHLVECFIGKIKHYIADPIKFLIKMYNQFFIFYYRNESI